MKLGCYHKIIDDIRFFFGNFGENLRLENLKLENLEFEKIWDYKKSQILVKYEIIQLAWNNLRNSILFWKLRFLTKTFIFNQDLGQYFGQDFSPRSFAKISAKISTKILTKIFILNNQLLLITKISGFHFVVIFGNFDEISDINFGQVLNFETKIAFRKIL